MYVFKGFNASARQGIDGFSVGTAYEAYVSFSVSGGINRGIKHLNTILVSDLVV